MCIFIYMNIHALFVCLYLLHWSMCACIQMNNKRISLAHSSRLHSIVSRRICTEALWTWYCVADISCLSSNRLKGKVKWITQFPDLNIWTYIKLFFWSGLTLTSMWLLLTRPVFVKPVWITVSDHACVRFRQQPITACLISAAFFGALGSSFLYGYNLSVVNAPALVSQTAGTGFECLLWGTSIDLSCFLIMLALFEINPY